MCTAITLNTNNFYFGRTLDIDESHGEAICVMPRNFPISFSRMGTVKNHLAIIGTATVIDNCPLFFDGVNEKGLAMAGLNFVGNAHYRPENGGFDNIAPYEFITWILSSCNNIAEAKASLERINLANIPFSKELPLASLHWIIAERSGCIVVEQTKEGLKIFDNPAGVMTNNPTFDYQLFNLNNYRGLTSRTDDNRLCDLPLDVYSNGLGALGLPGDFSSMSRFVRAFYLRQNSVCDKDEKSSVSQFFHILSGVEVARGACLTDRDTWNMTLYTCCMNCTRGKYYYTTYDNRQITCIDMHKEDLDTSDLKIYPQLTEQNIFYQN